MNRETKECVAVKILHSDGKTEVSHESLKKEVCVSGWGWVCPGECGCVWMGVGVSRWVWVCLGVCMSVYVCLCVCV